MLILLPLNHPQLLQQQRFQNGKVEYTVQEQRATSIHRHQQGHQQHDEHRLLQKYLQRQQQDQGQQQQDQGQQQKDQQQQQHQQQQNQNQDQQQHLQQQKDQEQRQQHQRQQQDREKQQYTQKKKGCLQPDRGLHERHFQLSKDEIKEENVSPPSRIQRECQRHHQQQEGQQQELRQDCLKQENLQGHEESPKCVLLRRTEHVLQQNCARVRTQETDSQHVRNKEMREIIKEQQQEANRAITRADEKRKKQRKDETLLEKRVPRYESWQQLFQPKRAHSRLIAAFHFYAFSVRFFFRRGRSFFLSSRRFSDPADVTVFKKTSVFLVLIIFAGFLEASLTVLAITYGSVLPLRAQTTYSFLAARENAICCRIAIAANAAGRPRFITRQNVFGSAATAFCTCVPPIRGDMASGGLCLPAFSSSALHMVKHKKYQRKHELLRKYT